MMAKGTSYDAAMGGNATDCVVRAYFWVDQLAGAQRGAIHGSHDAITSKVFAQAWELDATGNWSTLDQDSDGDWNVQQEDTKGMLLPKNRPRK